MFDELPFIGWASGTFRGSSDSRKKFRFMDDFISLSVFVFKTYIVTVKQI